MLIRSQDNQKITENINFTTVQNQKREYEIRHVDSWRLYGTYSTLAKAIKALDRLEKTYRQNGQLQMLSDGTITTVICNVFTFPEEKEIEDESEKK